VIQALEACTFLGVGSSIWSFRQYLVESLETLVRALILARDLYIVVVLEVNLTLRGKLW
jgi:hypothetical protein